MTLDLFSQVKFVARQTWKVDKLRLGSQASVTQPLVLWSRHKTALHGFIKICCTQFGHLKDWAWMRWQMLTLQDQITCCTWCYSTKTKLYQLLCFKWWHLKYCFANLELSHYEHLFFVHRTNTWTAKRRRASCPSIFSLTVIELNVPRDEFSLICDRTNYLGTQL